jgi:hypothetical protein
MERLADESFEDYKKRRAASNAAVKSINAHTKGGNLNTRANRLGIGIYGKALMAHFAKLNLIKLGQKPA